MPTIHVSATKRWMMQQILNDYFEGKVDNVDALTVLARDPYEFYTAAECDNRQLDGSCGGHP